MSQIYEGMFLLDNDVVREGYEGAKALVTGGLDKHGATVLSARRWDERRLAYPIDGRRRATFVIAYYQIAGGEMPALRREFDLSEQVLRYLLTCVDALPEGEVELALAEGAAEFAVPEPPDDDAPDPEPEPEEGAEGESASRAEGSDGDAGQGSGDVSQQGTPAAPAQGDAETPAAPAQGDAETPAAPAEGDAETPAAPAEGDAEPPASDDSDDSDKTSEKQEI